MSALCFTWTLPRFVIAPKSLLSSFLLPGGLSLSIENPAQLRGLGMVTADVEVRRRQGSLAAGVLFGEDLWRCVRSCGSCAIHASDALTSHVLPRRRCGLAGVYRRRRAPQCVLGSRGLRRPLSLGTGEFHPRAACVFVAGRVRRLHRITDSGTSARHTDAGTLLRMVVTAQNAARALTLSPPRSCARQAPTNGTLTPHPTPAPPPSRPLSPGSIIPDLPDIIPDWIPGVWVCAGLGPIAL